MSIFEREGVIPFSVACPFCDAEMFTSTLGKHLWEAHGIQDDPRALLPMPYDKKEETEEQPDPFKVLREPDNA